MNAAEVMSRSVIAVHPEAPLVQAVRLMIENRISGLPVLDDARHPVGMLTEGDLLRRVETGTEGGSPGWLGLLFTPGRVATDYIRSHARRVADVMTGQVVCVEETTPLEAIVDLMRRHRIRRLPVLRNAQVVGIVSRADLVHALARKLDAPAASSTDEAIRAAILAELSRQPWIPGRSVTVAVRAGVVQLDGTVLDLRTRDALRVAAENAPGVVGVENRILCIEPYTGIVLAGPGDETAGTAPGTR